MSKKIDFLKLKLKSYYSFKKLIFLNYKYSILYAECIVLTIVLSILTSHLIDLLQLLNYLPVYCFNTLKTNYTNLYINTGIALIGLSALIFTLKTFKKQALDEYMNSIFQKMFIGKLDTYLEYGYICLISILFLFIPSTSIFEQNILFFIPFYYFSLICILFMFGVELFIISNDMSKTNILKELKVRVKYLYDIGTKLGKYHSEYEKRHNNKQPSELQFIDKMNYTFLAYIQCINMIARKSFDDPIIFVESMDALYEITKYRLDIRKNKFNDYSVPLLSEVIPNVSNDTFIENHLLEYLDDYTKLALEQKNRDNMGTIERMYKQLLIAGKDNRYINNNKLELTIQIIFIYYLKMINDIVKFNNENMLFQTIEMFKQLFIGNGKYFNELVDKQFCDSMYQLSIESLQNKSLMNYRNIQGLLTIGFTGVLFNNYEYRSIYLDEIFKTIKLNLEAFYNSRRLIVQYDGARLYLNYILNPLEPLSLLSIFKNFYNSNISPDGKFMNMEIISKNDFKRLLDFIKDKDVIDWFIDLHNKRYFITCNTDISEICTFLLQISATICNTIDDQNIKDNYYELFDKTLKVSTVYILKFNDNLRMKHYKLSDFYSDIVYLAEHIINQDNKLKLILFNNYKKSIFQAYKNIDDDFSIEDLLKYFESIFIIFSEDEKSNEIKNVLEEIVDLLSDTKKFIIEFVNLKNKNHSFIGFNNSEIRKYIEPIMLEVVIEKVDNMNKKDIEFIYNKITKNEINKRINKKELLKMLKELLQK